MIEASRKIGARKVLAENLTLCISQQGEVDVVYDDDDLVDQIEASSYGAKIHFIEVRTAKLANMDDIVSTEINFSKFAYNKRGAISQQIITGGIPRFVDLHMDDTPIEMKKKIYKQIEDVFKKDDRAPSETDLEKYEEWVNFNINLQIKDNTPYVKSENGYSQRKAVSEFSGRRHNNRDDICEIQTADYKDGNDFENGGRQIKLRDLYDML